MSGETLLVHATAVSIGGRGVLLRGPSGSGKSDLALRLIDAGALLVADDQTRLHRDGDTLLMQAPQTIAGLIEARGVGILRVASVAAARLFLLVDLVPADRVERLPERQSEVVLGITIPVVALAPFEASATAKLRLALAAVCGDGTLPAFHG